MRDVVHLLRFQGACLRGRGRRTAPLAFAAILLLSGLAAWLPAYLPGAVRSPRAEQVLLLLPSAYLGVLVAAIVSAVATGGGRELLPRDQAVAYPVSPTTDHLGSLLMAPLNIAWLVQAWTLLGATAYVAGGPRILAAQLPVVLWLVVATAFAQVCAWAAEWLRRGRRGAWVLRAVVVALTIALALLVATGRLIPLVDRSPTVWVAIAALYGAGGRWLAWLGATGLLVLLAGASVALGAVAAAAAARRPPRDELRLESTVRPPRPQPRSDLLALLRVDRAGVWRSVPLRRGLAVLALLPGLVALAGSLEWRTLSILPGLVASGGALLFGVNAWCLDGTGTLWRDSVPVSPHLVFTSRVVVLVEVLLVASTLTLGLASLRAGTPTSAQLTAVACAAVVVCLQVVAASLRWSVHRPFAVDLRSGRATPAPPLVMVGYSTRLALSTTLTGLLFSLTARLPDERWSLLLAAPLLLFSAYRLARTGARWATPEVRSRVVGTVAG